MYGTAKETMCSSCEHLRVCSFTNQFLAADNVMVHNPDGSRIHLGDIKWIHPIRLECDYFLKNVRLARIDKARSTVE